MEYVAGLIDFDLDSLSPKIRNFCLAAIRVSTSKQRSIGCWRRELNKDDTELIN
jgi:hypothetical protein